jgi:hypothetical protein
LRTAEAVVSAVSAATPATTAAFAQDGTNRPPPNGEPPSLLTDPAAGALAGADPLSMLYLLESKDQQLGVDDGTKRIAALQTERHQALAQEQQAIQQAADAKKNGSFWDDLGSICGEVAKVAAVVASVAAAVATLGAGTPIAALAIAGAVLSSASFVDGECHVLRALGVDDKAAGWIDSGMAIGGAVLSVGAGIAAGGQLASSIPATVNRASAVVAGVGEIGKGVSTIEAGEARANSDQAAADQLAAKARSDHAQRLVQTVIDDTQSSDQAAQRTMGTIANTRAIQDQTTLSAATAVRG